jgi:hypothetical protein
MKKLEDILTAEELELATKVVKDIADKFFADITKEKSEIADAIQKSEEENTSLKKEHSEISDYGRRKEIWEERQVLSEDIELKKVDLKNIDNILKAISNGGRIVELKDETGKEYTKVADFRLISTESIVFDIDTILVDDVPPYIPHIDEKSFERRGTVLDTIRISEDTYAVCFDKYNYNKENKLFLLTLDQLMLTNLYYLTKLKATYKKEADRKTQKSKEYWQSRPLERRKWHINQENYYHSLPASVRKKYTETAWETLTFDKKEELAVPYKKYGSKKIKSELESTQMYSSFHIMYNVFISPNALPFTLNEKTNERTNIPIGKHVFGSYGHKEVFAYWNKFKEMMEYKMKDISFQRAELSETYKTAIETSFGESNTDDALLSEYGVLVKRQNGAKINASEIEQIKDSLNSVQHIFGGLKDLFIKNSIKISHTGKKLVFAMKAVGVYIPSMGTIGVSYKYGDLNFNSTMAHELGHFIDNEIGKKDGKRWATDNYESKAGIIAFTFRNLMNKPKSQQTDYVNATKECFARALQQYFVVKHYGDDAKIIYGYGSNSIEDNIFNQENYINKENFYKQVEPLIDEFLKENKEIFNSLVTPKNNKFEEPIKLPKINKGNELDEAIETLELLMDISDDKDKLEINEAIEILKILK